MRKGIQGVWDEYRLNKRKKRRPVEEPKANGGNGGKPNERVWTIHTGRFLCGSGRGKIICWDWRPTRKKKKNGRKARKETVL